MLGFDLYTASELCVSCAIKEVWYEVVVLSREVTRRFRYRLLCEVSGAVFDEVGASKYAQAC